MYCSEESRSGQAQLHQQQLLQLQLRTATWKRLLCSASRGFEQKIKEFLESSGRNAHMRPCGEGWAGMVRVRPRFVGTGAEDGLAMRHPARHGEYCRFCGSTCFGQNL